MIVAMGSFGILGPNLNGAYQKISLWLKAKLVLDERPKFASYKPLGVRPKSPKEGRSKKSRFVRVRDVRLILADVIS